MRFARFDGGKTGLVIGVAGDSLSIIDIKQSTSHLAAVDATAAAAVKRALPDDGSQDWTGMIAGWNDFRGAFQTLAGLAEDQRDTGLHRLAIETVTLEAPLASPTVRIFANAGNTTSHAIRVMKLLANLDWTEKEARAAKESGSPPPGFHVWTDTVVGPGATVAPPRGTQRFDYEGECAVYVQEGGRYLEDVKLWGYTAFNDLSVRDTHLGLAKEAQTHSFSFNIPKNFDTGKSCGPWVVVDEVDDLETLRCVLTVNGQVRQDWRLSEMVYSFNETLSYLSHGVALRPGDMLASGTGAGVAFEGGKDGTHYLQPGDEVEIKLDGLPPLRNTVGSW